jgi:hypothetical protein
VTAAAATAASPIATSASATTSAPVAATAFHLRAPAAVTAAARRSALPTRGAAIGVLSHLLRAATALEGPAGLCALLASGIAARSDAIACAGAVSELRPRAAAPSDLAEIGLVAAAVGEVPVAACAVAEVGCSSLGEIAAGTRTAVFRELLAPLLGATAEGLARRGAPARGLPKPLLRIGVAIADPFSVRGVVLPLPVLELVVDVRPRIGGRMAFEEPLGPRGTLRNVPTRT